MDYIDSDSFLAILRSGVELRLTPEVRTRPHIHHPTVTDAEYIGYRNEADGDWWDAVIVGYPQRLDMNKTYLSRKIFGFIASTTGNDKVLPLINLKGFSINLARKQIAEYMRVYQRKYPKIRLLLIEENQDE